MKTISWGMIVGVGLWVLGTGNVFAGAARPLLSVNGPLEYENVRIGTSASKDAEAVNTGIGTSLENLTFGATDPLGEFSPTTSDNIGSLLPFILTGDIATRPYNYMPTNFGDAKDTIDVTTSNTNPSDDSSLNQTIDLMGTGVGPIGQAPSLIDFGVVAAGDTAFADMLFQNAFNTNFCDSRFTCDLPLVGLTITGFSFDNGSLFNFAPPSGPTGDVIAADLGQKLYSLSFAGSTVGGPYTDTLRLFTDEGVAFGASDGKEFVVGLRATVSTAPPGQVPEPTTLALMGLALAGIGYRRHRSKIVS